MAKQRKDLLNNVIRFLGVSLLLGHPTKAAVSVVTLGGTGMAPVVLLGHGEVTTTWANNLTLEDTPEATTRTGPTQDKDEDTPEATTLTGSIQDKDEDEAVATATEYAFQSLTPDLYSFAEAVVRSPNRGSTFTANAVLAAKQQVFGRQGQLLLLTAQVSKKVDGYCVGLFDVTVHVDSQGSMTIAEWGEELPCPPVGTVDDWTYIGQDLLATRANIVTTGAFDAFTTHLPKVPKEPDTVVQIGEQVRAAVAVAMDSLSRSTSSYTFLNDVLNSNQTYMAEPDYAMELVEGGNKYYLINIDVLDETDMACVGSFEATIRVDETSTHSVVQWGPELPCPGPENNEDGSVISPIIDLTTDKVVAATSFVIQTLPEAIDHYSFKHEFHHCPKEHVKVVPILGTEKALATAGEQELTLYFDVIDDGSGECMGSFEATVFVNAKKGDLSMGSWGDEAPC